VQQLNDLILLHSMVYILGRPAYAIDHGFNAHRRTYIVDRHTA
jgi:hypothetical protein